MATYGRWLNSVRLMTIVGARPQFVKAAALSRAVAAHRALGHDVHEDIVHTGQHYDERMSDVFFTELGLPAPKYHLGVGSGPHGAQTGDMMRGLEEVVMADRPDHIVVYGDTNSTLAAALVAAKLRVPLAHVEAGLRSFDRSMPEEINRVVTDHVSDLLFCPSDVAAENLRREGLTKGVHTVGDVMFDVLQHTLTGIGATNPVIDRIGLVGPYVLATIHRPSNTDESSRLREIVGALSSVAETTPVVWPVHPRTLASLGEFRGSESLVLVPPATYEEMVALERGAAVIVTDSGGVQKEAFWLQVPCITLRDATEWTETVASGWNRLLGGSPEPLAAMVAECLGRQPGSLASPPAVYGCGDAAQRILNALL